MRRVKLPAAFVMLLLIISATIARQNDADDGVIHIETDLVLINATVTDNDGHYVPNLKAGDFLLEEEGKPRQIAHFAAEEAPFAAAILIDASGSMKTKLPRARVAAAQFADTLRNDDVMSVYSFNTEIEELQEFSSQHDISPDLWSIEARGQTRLYDCLYQAVESLASRPEQRRAIILISDGGDNNSRRSENQTLALALKAGATIYSIDIADGSFSTDASALQGSDKLKNFATKTGGQYIKTPGGQKLTERLLDISKEMRAQYTLGFYPDKLNSEGFRHLAVKVPTRPGAHVRARQGYNDQGSGVRDQGSGKKKEKN